MNLINSNDRLEIQTFSAAQVDAHADWEDVTTTLSDHRPGRTNTIIASPGSVTLINGPANNLIRQILELYIANKDPLLSVQIIVRFATSTNLLSEIFRGTLQPGERISYGSSVGWRTFNAQGVPTGIGATGDTGPTGLTGPQGTPGVDGEDGTDGDVGPQGPTGPEGPVGLIGPPGVDGEDGIDGHVGPMGPIGLQGPIGYTGAIGVPGVEGEDGADGSMGPVGQTGGPGPSGFIGPSGIDGDEGGVGPPGLTGPQGITGATGLVGPMGPIGQDGDEGDIGFPGLRGDRGAIGPQGPVGPAGMDGEDGADGISGPAGPGNSLALLAADFSITVAGFVDVDSLKIPCAPSKTYVFNAFLIYQTSTTAMGVLLAVNGPASPSLLCMRSEKQDKAAGTGTNTVFVYDVIAAYDTSVPSATSEVSAAVNLLHRFQGVFKNGSTAGALAIRLSKENVAGTATVKAGSFIRWREV